MVSGGISAQRTAGSNTCMVLVCKIIRCINQYFMSYTYTVNDYCNHHVSLQVDILELLKWHDQSGGMSVMIQRVKETETNQDILAIISSTAPFDL